MLLGGETGDIHTLSAAILDFLLSGMSLLLDEPLVVFKRPSKSIINRKLVSVCLYALTLWDEAPTLQWAVNYFSPLWRGKKKDEECFSLFEITHTSTHTHTNLCKWTWHFQRPYLKVSSWKHSHPTCYFKKEAVLSLTCCHRGSRDLKAGCVCCRPSGGFERRHPFIWTVLWSKWPLQTNQGPPGMAVYILSSLSLSTSGTCWYQPVWTNYSNTGKKRVIWKMKLQMSVFRKRQLGGLVRYASLMVLCLGPTCVGFSFSPTCYFTV